MPTKRKKKLDPIDAALHEEEKLAVQRRADDLRLLTAWKNDPTPENMRPLMQRFNPLFDQKVRMWKAPNVNEAAFKAELKLQAIKAFESYDPSKGAGVRTHLDYALRKAMRFNTQQQNNAYIPEEKAKYIGPIDSAFDALKEDLGRDPTHNEVAEAVNANLRGKKKPITAQKVMQIQNSRIRDVIASNLEQDVSPFTINRQREVVGLIRPSLPIEQQELFDYIYGLNGKPRIQSTSDLAARLGKTESQISRLKTALLKKFDSYL